MIDFLEHINIAWPIRPANVLAKADKFKQVFLQISPLPPKNFFSYGFLYTCIYLIYLYFVSVYLCSGGCFAPHLSFDNTEVTKRLLVL